MFKSALAAVAALPFAATSALAGPYVNVETNAGYTGNDYNGAVTDLHVGYEGDLGKSSGWYVQGGPAIVSVDGEENSTEFSGKVGLNVGVTERLTAYGELSALTEDQEFDTSSLNVGAKLGAKFAF